MAKRKAREIWISRSRIPKANRVCYSAALLRTSSKLLEAELIEAGYIRFVESPTKKARKK